MALCVLAGLTIVQGIRARRFTFVAYGILYAYAASASRCCGASIETPAVFAYFTVSGVVVIAGLVMLARRFGREE